MSPSPPRHHSPIVGATLSAASHAAFAIAITIFQPRRRTQFPIAAVAPMHWLRPSIFLCLFSGARTHCTTISLNFGRWAFAVLALARRLCHHHHLFHRRYYSSAPASPSPPPTSLPHRRRHHHYSCCPSANTLSFIRTSGRRNPAPQCDRTPHRPTLGTSWMVGPKITAQLPRTRALAVPPLFILHHII